MLILKPTGVNGVASVHRREDEKPFAELHSPSSRDSRKWGVKYRGSNPDRPFDPMVFNSAAPDKATAMYELEHAARVCSDRQLGLA